MFSLAILLLFKMQRSIIVASQVILCLRQLHVNLNLRSVCEHICLIVSYHREVFINFVIVS